MMINLKHGSTSFTWCVRGKKGFEDFFAAVWMCRTRWRNRGHFSPTTCGVLELQQCGQCTPLKRTVCTWKYGIPKGNSSSNHHSSGVMLLSGTVNAIFFTSGCCPPFHHDLFARTVTFISLKDSKWFQPIPEPLFSNPWRVDSYMYFQF